MMGANNLDPADRSAIFEQLHARQRALDADASRASAMACLDICWPEATFTAHDGRHTPLEGESGRKQLHGHAHGVFPLEERWRDLGPFAITGAGEEAPAEGRWIVNWRSKRQPQRPRGIRPELAVTVEDGLDAIARQCRVEPGAPAVRRDGGASQRGGLEVPLR